MQGKSGGPRPPNTSTRSTLAVCNGFFPFPPSNNPPFPSSLHRLPCVRPCAGSGHSRTRRQAVRGIIILEGGTGKTPSTLDSPPTPLSLVTLLRSARSAFRQIVTDLKISVESPAAPTDNTCWNNIFPCGE